MRGTASTQNNSALRPSAVRPAAILRAAFSLEPNHFEQIAEGFESGAPRHRREIRSDCRHITGYRRSVTGLVGLIGHCHSKPGKLQAQPRCEFPRTENTRSLANSNLFNGITFNYIPWLYCEAVRSRSCPNSLFLNVFGTSLI